MGLGAGLGRRLAVALCVFFVVAPAPAGAQEEDEVDAEESAAPAAPAGERRLGVYSGVRPGEAAGKPPRARRVAGFTPITWLGFQPREGGARVFLQLAAEVEVKQHVVGNELHVNVVGARFASRNTQRFFDVRFFETPLARISSKPVSKRRAHKDRPALDRGVLLTIEFKNPSEARQAAVSQSREQDGFVYLYLDFPAATR